MEFGKYRPLRYRIYEVYRTYHFTNIVQFRLALLSLSLFIIVLLWGKVWWWKMVDLSPLGWLAYGMGSAIVLVCIIVAVWSFVSFLIVCIRGWLGITIHYNKGELSPQIESAVEPKKFTNKELRKAINAIVSKNEANVQYLMNVLKYINRIRKF